MSSASRIEAPHLDNDYFVADLVSPACDRLLINQRAGKDIYHDTYFGNSWNWTPVPGAAVYGKTDAFPPTPIEELGSGEYLRVPFRRVPIIDLHSVAGLTNFANSVVSKDKSVRGVWRGQARQYSLTRSDEDKLRLYGDTSIIEPSLLPSASRNKFYFPDVFETWAGLLDLYMEERQNRMADLDPSRREELLYKAANFRSGYNYRLWGFATAQHYGLPSVGLDVTHDILVALFFALHRFSIEPKTGVMTMERTTETDNPIIYGLGGFENDLLDDEKLALPWLQCARPQAQSAMFFATGWGNSSNKAADRIYVALRLVGHTDWVSPLTGRDVFPSVSDDPFLDFLLASQTLHADPLLQEMLRRVYFLP